MNMMRIGTLLKKDFLFGPRKPFFIWALFMPFVLTLLFQVVFGSLFEPTPRLGIVDAGTSEITQAVAEMEGIELTLLDQVSDLKQKVERNDLDAGLVLTSDFDQALRAGQKPLLAFYIGGESLASNRIILMVTALDLLRQVEGRTAPVDVQTEIFGQEGLPMSIRVIPVLVFYALVIAGIFVPGSSLVEEKETGTAHALLVTPVRPSELLLTKWILGWLLSSVMAIITLFLNQALGPRPLDVIAVVAVASSLCAMLGLLVGLVSKNSTTLFTIIKGAGVLLFAPVIFYIFPDWPQWIAQLFPLYWIIEPIWQVSVMGQPLVSVWFEVTIAVGITVLMIPLITVIHRRIQW